MRISLSGHKFTFPQQCACCGATPQTTLTASASRSTGKRVVHTTTKAWDFPYCIPCIGHVRTAKSAGTLATFIIITSFIIAGLVGFASDAWTGAVWVGVAGVVCGIWAHHSLMKKAKRMCLPNCTCVKSAVGYQGWQGSCHEFEVVSPAYALAFMGGNHTKLVNVRPEVWQWLQANGFGASPDRPQSAKRYVT